MPCRPTLKTSDYQVAVTMRWLRSLAKAAYIHLRVPRARTASSMPVSVSINRGNTEHSILPIKSSNARHCGLCNVGFSRIRIPASHKLWVNLIILRRRPSFTNSAVLEEVQMILFCNEWIASANRDIEIFCPCRNLPSATEGYAHRSAGRISLTPSETTPEDVSVSAAGFHALEPQADQQVLQARHCLAMSGQLTAEQLTAGEGIARLIWNL